MTYHTARSLDRGSGPAVTDETVTHTGGIMRFPTPGHGTRCFRCGHEASAALAGAGGTLGICGGCALDVLPAMLAEAISFTPGADLQSGYEHALDYASGPFWKAAFCRLYDSVRPFPPEQSPDEGGIPL